MTYSADAGQDSDTHAKMQDVMNAQSRMHLVKSQEQALAVAIPHNFTYCTTHPGLAINVRDGEEASGANHQVLALASSLLHQK